MRIRVITIEREYGSGGSVIAKKLGARLGWKVWDEALTQEIARVANVDPKVAERCDERVDPFLRRLFKVYARGSYERSLPDVGAASFDTDLMVALLHDVITHVAAKGECIVVGRGSPYILRNRPDALHVFTFAPEEEKIRRLRTIGQNEREARSMIQEIDGERFSFIKRYFGKDWPYRPLYDLMLNTVRGDECVIDVILATVAEIEKVTTKAAANPAASGQS